MTQTFGASTVSTRSLGAQPNWLMLLVVLIWAECIVVCHCSVITRQVDVNDVENSFDEAEQNPSDEAANTPKQSQYLNCYPVSSCYDDCTERLKGNLHVDQDCQALGAEYGFRATYLCQCHFEDIVHEDEETNELPEFPAYNFQSSNSHASRNKRNLKNHPVFLVSEKK